MGLSTVGFGRSLLSLLPRLGGMSLGLYHIGYSKGGCCLSLSFWVIERAVM